MADTNNAEVSAERRIGEPVCIDARRVFDSCSDKDCLSELPVFFTAEDQAVIDDSVNLRFRDAQVADVTIDTEPVPFHRGFYSIDIVYYFVVTFDAYSTPSTTPTSVTGVCVSDKKAILYGSEGNVKVFSSTFVDNDIDTANASYGTMPIANVQVARPIALAAGLRARAATDVLTYTVPQAVLDIVGGELTETGTSTAIATLGVFSIVQLMREVQMLLPSYDYCIPDKSCSYSTDSPCDMFSRLDFPTDEFFPPSVCEISSDTGGGCGCDSDNVSDK